VSKIKTDELDKKLDSMNKEETRKFIITMLTEMLDMAQQFATSAAEMRMAVHESMLLMSKAPLKDCEGKDECEPCYWRGSVVGLYDQIAAKPLEVEDSMTPEEAMKKLNTILRSDKMYDA